MDDAKESSSKVTIQAVLLDLGGSHSLNGPRHTPRVRCPVTPPHPKSALVPLGRNPLATTKTQSKENTCMGTCLRPLNCTPPQKKPMTRVAQEYYEPSPALSKACDCTHPNPWPACTSLGNSAAYSRSFLGTQPRKMQVPPMPPCIQNHCITK